MTNLFLKFHELFKSKVYEILEKTVSSIVFLRNTMTKKIRSDIAPLKTKTTKQEVPELISLQDLAAHLEINPRTLKTWIASGKIPTPSRIGNRKAYRWNVQKINSWLLAQESN